MSSFPPGQPSLRVFIGYAEADREHKERLVVHLAALQRDGLIDVWHPGLLEPGAEAEAEMSAELDRADLALFLLSADFIASPAAFHGALERALQQRRERQLRVVPLRVRSADIGESVLTTLEALPASGPPIAEAANADAAWAEVARALRVMLRRPASEYPPEAVSERKKRDFVARVARVAKLRSPDAEVTELDAAEPFDGLVIVTTRSRRVVDIEPIGVLDGPITAEALAVFARSVEAPYRRENPLLRARIVHTGGTAPDEMHELAPRGVVLDSFAQYQGLLDFSRYLDWQTRTLLDDPIYPPGKFVPQRMTYRLGRDEHAVENALDTVEKWLSYGGRQLLLLLGDFGTGKTYLTHQLALALEERGRSPIPVLIELRRLDKTRTLEELLGQHFVPERGMRRFDHDAFRYMLEEGRIVLLFDGFDELALRVSYERATEHFDTVLEAAMSGSAKVVLTSRTQHFMTDRQVLTALANKAASHGFRIAKLGSFDEARIQRFLQHRLGSEEKAAERLAMLRNVRDLIKLSENPRMLGFITRLSEDQLREAQERAPNHRITAAVLYGQLLQDWLDGEFERAHPRGVSPGLSLEQRWKAVTEVARLLWHTQRWALPINEVPMALVDAVVAVSNVAMDTGVATHQIGSGTLLCRDEDGSFRFLHQSVLEWLIAREAAEELQSTGKVTLFSERDIGELLADFFIDLAGVEQTIEWARGALAESPGSALAKNALKVLHRLKIEAEAEVSTQPIPVLDLSGGDLRGQDYSGSSYLRGAKLDGANLSGTTLIGADLVRASLSRASLAWANAEKADLRNANLAGADLWGARLLGADLRGASLEGSSLRYTKLIGATVDPEALKSADTYGATTARPRTAEPATLGDLFQDVGTYGMGLSVSPDGALLAAGYGGGTIVLWDMASGRALREWGAHAGQVTSLTFSADGEVLVSGSDDKIIKLWEVKTATLLRSLDAHSKGVWSVALSPDGKLLASGSYDKTVKLWDVEKAALLCSLDAGSNGVLSVAFSPDGKLLASGSYDKIVRLWEVGTRRLLRSIEAHTKGVWSVAFSPNGRLLASGSYDKTVKLWDIATGIFVRLLDAHTNSVLSVAFSPDGKVLASGSSDKSVKLWDAATGKLLHSLDAHANWVRSVTFAPDGQWLASGSDDKTVKLWDVKSATLLHSLDAHSNGIWSVAFSPNGQRLATGSDDGTVRIWDVKTAALQRSLEEHSNGVLSVVYSPDLQILASGSSDKTVKLWDVRTSNLLRSLDGHTNWVRSIAFSPDGQVLASSSDDKTVKLWNVKAGTLVRSLDAHSNWVRCVAFSPSGDLLVSGSDDKSIILWNVKTAMPRRSLHAHTNWVLGLAFSPDGQLFASSSADRTVKLWEVKTARLLHSLDAHSNWVLSVAFSPDGKYLASGAYDTTIKLWDVRSGELLRSLDAHSNSVHSVAFSPNGQALASAARDGTIRLWRVADGTCLAVLVPAERGWAAFTPGGRYKIKGDVAGRFWHVVGLCRFEPGELDDYTDAFEERKPLRLKEEDPLW